MAEKYPLHDGSLHLAHNHWRHRVVTELVFAPPEYGVLSIEQDLIEVILPYSEPGEMGPTIWFEVIRSDGSFSRHNGTFIDTVNFVEVPPAERMADE
jgi:hypothetical protein